MTSRRGRRLAAAFALALALVPRSAPAAGPEEPEGYRLEDYRRPVPETLAGAHVLTSEAAMDLHRHSAAVFVDVLPRPPKPAGLPPGTLWRDPPRESIPGSAWLPNVGYGDLAAEVDAYYRGGLARLTAGDRTHPVVVFCLAQCWMSWNAAKRALSYGYTRVYWYPEGTDGWAAAGGRLAPVEPMPDR